MKKNCLHTAILAGLAGVSIRANIANAVNLSPDRLGQVLVYPYYTTNQGDMLLPMSDGPAVKVRFLEARNSREVLDFNLYLPHDDIAVYQLMSAPRYEPLPLVETLYYKPPPLSQTAAVDVIVALSQLVENTAPDYGSTTFVITRREVGDLDWPMIDLTPEHVPDHVRQLTARTQRQLKPNPFASRQTARHGGYTPGASGPRRTAG